MTWLTHQVWDLQDAVDNAGDMLAIAHDFHAQQVEMLTLEVSGQTAAAAELRAQSEF